MLPSQSCQNLNIESIGKLFEFQFIFRDHSFSSVGRVQPSGPDVSPKRQPDPMGTPRFALFSRITAPGNALNGSFRSCTTPSRSSVSLVVVRNFACGWTSYYASHDISGSLLRGVQRKSPCLLFVARTFSRHENFSLRMGACHIMEDLSFYSVPRERGKWSSPRFVFTLVVWGFSGQLVS
jgi:hypothetical protein